MIAAQPASKVRLTAEQLGQLEGWATTGYPREVCGLLTGSRAAGVVQVVRLTEVRNRRADRPEDRYEIAPEDFLAEDRRARAEGLEVLGFWHSHPDRPAHASRTDLDAAWPGYVYLIVSATAARATGLRAWRVAKGRLVDLELVPAEDHL